MTNPREIEIATYTYELPTSKISTHPLEERDLSKLLVYYKGSIISSNYRHISDFIDADSVMVFNDTRVINARLLFKNDTGASIELFCLEPSGKYADITTGMAQTRAVEWRCLVGRASKWKQPTLSRDIDAYKTTLNATVAAKENDSFLIHFTWDSDLTFSEILQYAGAVPLPPYIKREAESADRDRYQTIFSLYEGSVAAPTAGLHFTQGVLESLTRKGIEQRFITLHVGAGTFKPVKAAQMQDHEMHAEYLDVSLNFLEHIKNGVEAAKNTYKPLNIVAVGTTATRTLESLYWLGVKIALNSNISPQDLSIHQWDGYELDGSISVANSLNHLITFLIHHKLDRIVTTTQLLIAPGYQWRLVTQLVTNFHQPNSTLLLLVASLIGEDWRKVYDYALENDYRFLSYGDGCILKP